jgi:hypothetical protein
VKLNVPAPLLLTLSDAGVGSIPPTIPLNANVLGVTDNIGCVIVSVTVMTLGDPCAPAAVIVTCPVYVPAVNGRLSWPTVDAETCSVCGAVPLPGVTVSQGTSAAALKLIAPAPVFVTLTKAGAGLGAPTSAVKLKVVGDTARTGEGGLTISVTVTTPGEPGIPGELTVTCAV